MPTSPHRRALLSVYDKRGVVDFARQLVELGWEIISTGGTARALEDAGLPVVPVEEYTGFPEILDGRVKTLHPVVHGGILYRRGEAEHEAAVDRHGIVAVDMVVVNLYPFERVAAEPDATPERIIENIDIGGPAMIRSAAKNHRDVLVIVNPDRYAEVAQALQDDAVAPELRRDLAREAFARTMAYDAAITTWFRGQDAAAEQFPALLDEKFEKLAELRYGENPHQPAAVYRRVGTGGPTLGAARLLPGSDKELSYNNYLDADAALALALDLPGAGICILKHCNPCGAAVGSDDDLPRIFADALAGDPTSAFGGIVGINRKVDVALAEALTQKGTFFEVIVAPDYDADAVEILRTKKKWGANLRLLAVGDIGATIPFAPQLRSISGGLLVQERDGAILGPDDPRVVTERAPTEEERRDLELAWVLSKHVRSNAITLAKGGRLLAAGAGQMSRVGSVEIAVRHAGEDARGAALGSDAFFPFPDGIEAAAKAGVTAAIQPGGSKKDADVIAAANEHGLTMLFTGVRHFRH